MKKFFTTAIKFGGIFIGLFFIIILSWALIVSMLKHFSNELTNADKTIVLAVISAFVSVITLIISKNQEKNAIVFFEKKKTNQQVYENMIRDILAENKTREMIKQEYLPFVYTHSDVDVYIAFTKYCDSNTSKKEELFFAIRKELNLINRKWR